MSPRSLYTLALPALAFAAAGCDLLSSAKSTVVVAGILASSPAVQLEGHFDIAPETLATSYLGERENATSTEEPQPLSGADVSLHFAGNTVALLEKTGEPGVYVASSVDNAALVYSEGALYAFDAEIPGFDSGPYGGAVTTPTRLVAASLTLEPQPQPVMNVPNLYSHPKNTALTVTWRADNGRYAYVTVYRADATAPDRPEMVFDSAPKTGGEMVKFILGTPPTSITIPADTFARDGGYAVLIVAADKGEVKNNTFLGSPILAGTGEKVLLAVGDFTP